MPDVAALQRELIALRAQASELAMLRDELEHAREELVAARIARRRAEEEAVDLRQELRKVLEEVAELRRENQRLAAQLEDGPVSSEETDWIIVVRSLAPLFCVCMHAHTLASRSL